MPPCVIISSAESDFVPVVEAAISTAVAVLLSQKHLYQSVRVGVVEIKTHATELEKSGAAIAAGRSMGGARRPSAGIADYIYTGDHVLEQQWQTERVALAPKTLSSHPPTVVFHPPATIETGCDVCGGRWPFNPRAVHEDSTAPAQQSFTLSYQCQRCKTFVANFLVRRSGNKLTLAGRDPMEQVIVPDVLPKDLSRYFGDAHIAFNAGQVLPGMFMLRVFVEQFWRRIPEVRERLQHAPRPRGDELAEIYQETLPTDFKQRFPSLAKVYGALSAKLHEADADPALFESCSADIVLHFEARKLFRLTVPNQPANVPQPQ